MTTISLASYVVRDSNGAVDVSATLDKFQDDLETYQAERETELGTIGDAVHAVFATHKGASINMPALTSLTLTKLSVQPENFATLSERVQDYVRTNPEFHIGKGKGGGVILRADATAEKLAKIAESEAKAAAKAAK
jgi:hypothetical protein